LIRGLFLTNRLQNFELFCVAEMKIFKSIVLSVFIFIASAELVDAVPIESRLQTVEKLLTVSSAARQINESDNEAAKLKLESARKIFLQARTAAASGDGDQAGALLDEAARALFSATRMLKKDDALIKKDLSDFDTRMSSINALCDAYHNIHREKGLGDPKSSALYPFVQERLAFARDLKQQNRLVEGRKTLDEAYVAIKVAIEHLRGGETLVRSLNFESAEQEYDYEVDRNNTHSMLIQVLLKEKIDADSNVKSMVNEFMAKAKVLRAKADEQAAAGEYEAAINTLEQSTKEIVRAIRSAGIYIPG